MWQDPRRRTRRIDSFSQIEKSMKKKNRLAVDDNVTRIRKRYYKARRAGMSTADATAYANGPDSAEPSGPVSAQVELPALPVAADGGGDARLHLNNGSAS